MSCLSDNILAQMNRIRPRVHCLTNPVTMQDVGLNDQLDREKLEQEIREFIRKSGGQVDNLSLIYEEIHKKHSTFDIKDYGYSRLSSFLKSIRSLSVNGNTVRIREKK